MMAEPPQVKTTPITLEPLTPTEKREQAIELLSQLFSSGRPLSEVLDQAKQLVAINAGLTHELTAIGEAEPVPATIMDQPPEPYVDSEHNPDITDRLLIEKSRAFRLPQPTARTLVWLVPVIGLGVLSAAAATAVFENRDVISVGPTLTANPVAQLSEKLPIPSPAVSALPGTIPETNNAALSAEEVAVLLARGDALGRCNGWAFILRARRRCWKCRGRHPSGRKLRHFLSGAGPHQGRARRPRARGLLVRTCS